MFAAAALAQTPVFRTGVSLVHLDTEVLSHDGHTVANLSKDDFRIFDEGKEQPVTGFLGEEQPLDLILLFDVSGSMQAVARQVASAARESFAELQPGDRVSVMTFNSRTTVVEPFNEDLDAVERAIQNKVLSLRFGGGTLIQKAVDEAALAFRREPRSERRRAVLIVTDDIGLRTQHEMEVVKDFWESDALLAGLVVRSRIFDINQKIGAVIAPQMIILRKGIEAGFQGIADKTGGEAIHTGAAGPAFHDLMHRIRSRYSLYYALPQGEPGQRRSVKVSLAAAALAKYPQARVRTRHGYVMP
jgi:VWFA-related protein